MSVVLDSAAYKEWKDGKAIYVCINSPVLAATLGHTLHSDCVRVASKRSVPLDREWRNRLRDSYIDNCVSIVTPTKKKTTSSAPSAKSKEAT